MSNKMPNEPPKETESAPKKSFSKLVFGVLILIFGAWVFVSGLTGLLDNKSRLITPNSTIIIETVDTPELRQLGLSGRTSIDDKYGMLFVFDEPDIQHCLIMRDMLISIDMVWFNEEKEVINVKQNATPESYPEVFCPDAPAKYALEIKANTAEDLGIKPGEKLRF